MDITNKQKEGIMMQPQWYQVNGQWVHIQIVAQDDRVTVYVDGAEAAEVL